MFCRFSISGVLVSGTCNPNRAACILSWSVQGARKGERCGTHLCFQDEESTSWAPTDKYLQKVEGG